MPKRQLLKRAPSSSPTTEGESPPKRRLRKCIEVDIDEIESHTSSSSSGSLSNGSSSDSVSSGNRTPPAERPRRAARRQSVSDVKGQFRLHKLASQRHGDMISEEGSQCTDDDDFIVDDDDDEDDYDEYESNDDSPAGFAQYHLIDEKIDEQAKERRQSASLTIGAKVRSPEIAFYEYIEYLTVCLCEPSAPMNTKYSASVKRIEGELEQAREARGTMAWDSHGGLYRRGLDLYPDLITQPTDTPEESTRLLRKKEDRCLACNQRRWKLDARLGGRMCDSRRIWKGDMKYWYRYYNLSPLISPPIEVGVVALDQSSSSDEDTDNEVGEAEELEEVQKLMVDNWFHLGPTCRKNTEDYQFLQNYKGRLIFRIYNKLKEAATITKTEMALAILNKDDEKWKKWKKSLFEEYSRITDSAFNLAELKRVRNEHMIEKFDQ